MVRLRFRSLAAAATVLAFATIIVGGFTSATDSGLGCGDDWPLCHGSVVPEFHGSDVVIEYTHRVLAIALGVIGLGLLATAVRGGDEIPLAARGAVVVSAMAYTAQALVGMLVVKAHLLPEFVSLHAGLAALTTSPLVVAWFLSRPHAGPSRDARLRWFVPLAGIAVASAFFVILVGGYTTATASGLGCGEDWPHCNGTLTPSLEERTTLIEWMHRLSATNLGLWGLALLGYTIRNRDALPGLAAKSVYAAAGLFASQAVLGGLVVMTTLRAELVAVHAGVASALFSALVLAIFAATRITTRSRVLGPVGAAATTLALAVTPTANAESAPLHGGKREAADAAPGDPEARSRLADYVEMVKPGILSLLLVVGAAAMLVAPGDVTWQTVVGTLVGGGLAACAAAVMNNVIERNKDAKMARTKKRALASGRVGVREGIVFAGALTVASVGVLAATISWVAGAFALGGLLFYVIVYTCWLKPYTPQNIVIGGAAGCAPAFVGWFAVTNEWSLAPVILGLLVFLWTPPHFWALALVYKNDYAKAAFPMHPIARGESSTRRQILGYTVLTVVASLALLWPLDVLGWFYAASALALGGVFLWYAWRVLRDDQPRVAYGMFKFSIVYLGLLYMAMIVDRVVENVLF